MVIIPISYSEGPEFSTSVELNTHRAFLAYFPYFEKMKGL
jgi:hypothetical protein